MPEADNTEKLQPQGREECAPSLRPVAVVVHSRVSSGIAELHRETPSQTKPTVKTVSQELWFLLQLSRAWISSLSLASPTPPAFVEELRRDCIVSSPLSPRAGGISVCSVKVRGSQNAGWGHGSRSAHAIHAWVWPSQQSSF